MKVKQVLDYIWNEDTEYKTSIPVLLDNDLDMVYETHGHIRKIIEKVHLPILNFISPQYGKLAKKMSPEAKKLVERAGSYNALEIIHEYSGFKPKSKKIAHLITAVGEYHWQNTATAKGGRNRLKMVKKIIKNIISISNSNLKHIVIQGASFSRPQIEVLSELKYRENIKLTLIDKNDGPLDFAKSLSEQLGVRDRIELIKDKISNVGNYITDDTIIVENIGISDYFKKKKSTEIAALVRMHLSEGGTYLSGNIRPNPEYRFVTKGGRWVMDYKYEKDLAEIFVDAGYNSDEILVVYEPCQIFGIVFNTKNIPFMKNALINYVEK